MQRVDTGLSKDPTHMLMRSDRQNRSICLPIITGVKTISRSKGNLGTSKTRCDVSTCLSWPLNISDREFNLGRALCFTLAAIAVDSHSKPGRV